MNLVEILTATIGTAAFSLVFNIKKDKIISSGIGGMLAWLTYLIVFRLTDNNFLANMIASFVVCIYAEILARKLKAPANIFLLPAIFPLIPGGSLYYTMDGLVMGDKLLTSLYGIKTVEAMLGIVVGIVLGSSFFYSIVVNIKSSLKSK